MTLKYFLGLIFFLASTIFYDVQAQCALYEVYLEQKVNESQNVIEGEVIAQQCFKSALVNKIFTLNTIKVYTVLKGKVPEEIYIVTAGGRLNNQIEIASSLLSLNIGSIGLFFLNKELADPALQVKEVHQVFASSQGFYQYNLPEMLVLDEFNIYSNAGYEFYQMLEKLYQLKVNERYLPLDWGNNNMNNRLTIINNFSPTKANAGVGEQITINGFGFGSSRGNSKVLFKSADDGFGAEIAAEAPQYISWSDTKIVVAIPSKAGTGKIAVDLGVVKAQSNANLQIDYAIINTGSDASIYAPRHVARNANKGYIWHMNVNFAADSIANANFLVSFKKWRCKTFINWSIGNNTTINSSARDTLSVISYDENNELPVGVLGLCYGYYSGCSADDWYIEEQDMLFRKSDLWHFGDGAISTNQLDFQSVALHELGHAHQLAHVNNNVDLMHYSIGFGIQKRNIESSNFEAAQWIMNKSLESDLCDKKKMQLLDSDLCNDELFGYYNTVVYPNPFTEFLRIDIYLSKSQNLKIDLYDITGKLIVAYENEIAPKGFLPIEFDVPNRLISAGVYILKIEIGTEKMVEKLIKQ